jgi:hypothetical protein
VFVCFPIRAIKRSVQGVTSKAILPIACSLPVGDCVARVVVFGKIDASTSIMKCLSRAPVWLRIDFSSLG